MESGIKIIGLIVPDLADTHFSKIAGGVAHMLQPKGYTVLISNSEGNAEAERHAIDLLLSCAQVEGLILASAQQPEETALFRRLDKHEVPYVLVDRDFSGVDANCVAADDEEIGAVSTEHLMARRCRHIAFIQGPETSASIARLRGYMAALGGHGLRAEKGYVVRTGNDDRSGRAAMGKLLTLAPRVDGVLCFSDAIAVGAIKAILEAGLEVPDDIEIVGAGNVHYSDILRVPLSTIDLHSTTMGEFAARMLLEVLEQTEPRPATKVTVPFDLIARESSRQAAV